MLPLLPVSAVIAVVRILFAAMTPEPENPRVAPLETVIVAVVLTPVVMPENAVDPAPPEHVPAIHCVPCQVMHWPTTAPDWVNWAGLTMALCDINP